MFFVLLIRTLYQINLGYRLLSLCQLSSPYYSVMSVKSRLKKPFDHPNKQLSC